MIKAKEFSNKIEQVAVHKCEECGHITETKITIEEMKVKLA